jgi:hypothetical protein
MSGLGARVTPEHGLGVAVRRPMAELVAAPGLPDSAGNGAGAGTVIGCPAPNVDAATVVADLGCVAIVVGSALDNRRRCPRLSPGTARRSG